MKRRTETRRNEEKIKIYMRNENSRGFKTSEIFFLFIYIHTYGLNGLYIYTTWIAWGKWDCEQLS